MAHEGKRFKAASEGVDRKKLYALNEALTIATENARLTGKDRIFAAGRFFAAEEGITLHRITGIFAW